MSFALATVKEIRKVDDYTIDIITKGPDPILLLNMPNFTSLTKSGQKLTTHLKLYARVALLISQTLTPMAHPFKLVEWIQDTRLVLEPK